MTFLPVNAACLPFVTNIPIATCFKRWIQTGYRVPNMVLRAGEI